MLSEGTRVQVSFPYQAAKTQKRSPREQVREVLLGLTEQSHLPSEPVWATDVIKVVLLGGQSKFSSEITERGSSDSGGLSQQLHH